MRNRARTRYARTALSVVLFLFACPSRAQTAADSAAAQGLFDAAKTLMAAGNAREACPKLEESQRLDPSSGTLMNLAKCYEETGRLASAWSKYLEAAVAAKMTGNAARESGAREFAAGLAPRVSKLVVNVPPDARVPGLQITRDGAVVGPAQWGLAIPEDDGEHTIMARAPGHRDWQTVSVVKGEGATTSIAVPKLTDVAVPPPDEQRTSGLGTQRVVALVAGGVGVVGLGLGTAFGLKAMSEHGDAEKYCAGAGCTDPRGVTAGNNAHSAGNVATIGMVVGAVGLAGGLTLWFTAPKRGATPAVGLAPGSVQLEGTW